jgi:hypothetical protein
MHPVLLLPSGPSCKMPSFDDDIDMMFPVAALPDEEGLLGLVLLINTLLGLHTGVLHASIYCTHPHEGLAVNILYPSFFFHCIKMSISSL